MTSPRAFLVATAKNEGPFLLEWVAHHLAIGFTDLVVYTNDCSDGTDDMLIRLEELGLAHHRRNVIPEGLRPQPSALNYAQEEPVVCKSDLINNSPQQNGSTAYGSDPSESPGFLFYFSVHCVKMPYLAIALCAKGCAMRKIASGHSKSGFAENVKFKSRTISSATAQKWIKAEIFYLSSS